MSDSTKTPGTGSMSPRVVLAVKSTHPTFQFINASHHHAKDDEEAYERSGNFNGPFTLTSGYDGSNVDRIGCFALRIGVRQPENEEEKKNVKVADRDLYVVVAFEIILEAGTFKHYMTLVETEPGVDITKDKRLLEDDYEFNFRHKLLLASQTQQHACRLVDEWLSVETTTNENCRYGSLTLTLSQATEEHQKTAQEVHSIIAPRPKLPRPMIEQDKFDGEPLPIWDIGVTEDSAWFKISMKHPSIKMTRVQHYIRTGQVGEDIESTINPGEEKSACFTSKTDAKSRGTLVGELVNVTPSANYIPRNQRIFLAISWRVDPCEEDTEDLSKHPAVLTTLVLRTSSPCFPYRGHGLRAFFDGLAQYTLRSKIPDELYQLDDGTEFVIRSNIASEDPAHIDVEVLEPPPTRSELVRGPILWFPAAVFEWQVIRSVLKVNRKMEALTDWKEGVEIRIVENNTGKDPDPDAPQPAQPAGNQEAGNQEAGAGSTSAEQNIPGPPEVTFQRLWPILHDGPGKADVKARGAVELLTPSRPIELHQHVYQIEKKHGDDTTERRYLVASYEDKKSRQARLIAAGKDKATIDSETAVIGAAVVYEIAKSHESEPDPEPLSGETIASFVKDTGVAATHKPGRLVQQQLLLSPTEQVAIRQYRTFGPVAITTTTLANLEQKPPTPEDFLRVVTQNLSPSLENITTTILSIGVHRQNVGRTTDRFLEKAITDYTFGKLPLTSDTQPTRNIRLRYATGDSIERTASDIHVIEVNASETEEGAIRAEVILFGADGAEITAVGIDHAGPSTSAAAAASSTSETPAADETLVSAVPAPTPAARGRPPAPIPVGRRLASGYIELAPNAKEVQPLEVRGQLQADTTCTVTLQLTREGNAIPLLKVILQ